MWQELGGSRHGWFCCGWGGRFFWLRSVSGVDNRSNGVLLRAVQRTRAVRGGGKGRVGGPRHCAATHTTLKDTKVLVTWTQVSTKWWICTISVWVFPTCVSISGGIVCCWIQGWTSASSSLCFWVNQGWRGWSTRSFSLSSDNTSFWSLEGGWRQGAF